MRGLPGAPGIIIVSVKYGYICLLFFVFLGNEDQNLTYDVADSWQVFCC